MQRPGYIYSASNYGPKEVELYRLFRLQRDDARNYFLTIIKPRLDRSYKLYIAYGGDRQREIQKWQSNVQVPYVQAAVETMVPRILDARPEFIVRGRKSDFQEKAQKQQKLMDFYWEKAGMDGVSEDFVRSILIYGTGFLQVSWKKDVRKLKFLNTKDISNHKPKWEEKEKVFYDAPYCEWIDNYNLWYDWHNTARKSKQFWFKRFVLTGMEIARRYPMADPERLQLALNAPGGDLIDYAAIRPQVRTTHIYNTKSSQSQQISASGTVYGTDKYYSTQDNTLKMYEVFEWWRPYDDAYSVVVGGSYVPIFKDGFMPNPYDFKEVPFIEATYLKIPGEFEGYGLPLILESPQVMLNLIKNQRLDAATLSIHKMWVVNPLANVNKDELVTRPFGIIYSIDPNGVREIQFSDIKPSAYKEEELLKGDMQYASGVDDFSMGKGGGGSSATEVRHLRESTLERVRMFVNHLGDAYADVLRYWMDMTRQLQTEDMTIRIIGEDGKEDYPLIQKDDLKGEYDYRAAVLPSIAGQDDIKKKQDMDLFQLLITLPFIDPQKLVSRVLVPWGWSLDGLLKGEEEEQPQMDPAAMMAQGGGSGGKMDPMAMMAMMGAGQQPQVDLGQPIKTPSSSLTGALSMLRRPGEAPAANPFAQMSSPVNLLQSPGVPPTPAGVGGPGYGKMPNLAGFARGAGSGVNTTISLKKTADDAQSSLLSNALSLQPRKK